MYVYWNVNCLEFVLFIVQIFEAIYIADNYVKF